MDGGDGFRNWGYYEPSFKGHLNLQLMPSVAEERDTKQLLFPIEMVNADRRVYQPPQYQPRRHHHQQQQQHFSLHGHAHPHRTQEFEISEPPPLQYMSETWVMHHRDKFMNIMSRNSSFGVTPEGPGGQPLRMMEQPVVQLPKMEMVIRHDDPVPSNVEGPGPGTTKKRRGVGAPKMPKVKKPKKVPSVPKEKDNGTSQRIKPPKKNVAVIINGVDMDISNIPIPICTCTGAPQQCYRWGCGGWQSACCTTSISVYPLPMSTKRRGARIAGRKMSLGAFKKVLEKNDSEGYNFALPIDLKSYWARHGTNKFVTIR